MSHADCFSSIARCSESSNVYFSDRVTPQWRSYVSGVRSVWRREVLSIRFRMKALVYKESGSNPNLLIAEIFFSALVYPYLNV